MNAYIVDGDLVSQLKSEWLHIALLAVYSGSVGVFVRAIRLGDERVEKIAAQLAKNTEELASHSRQIRDTRAAVACCETSLEIQHYPYTD
jgi:hypothetical protein